MNKFMSQIPARLAVAGLAALTLLAAPAALADDKGRSIAKKIDASYSGYRTSKADGQMILYTGGRKATRTFTSQSLEKKGGNANELNVLVFDSPKDMRGVALLTHARTEPNDDFQWLFLPAAARTKRITSSNKSGKFVSSEFSYEDLAKQDVDEFTYTWLRTESCPGSNLTCEVIEAFPKSRASGYKKRVIWADTKQYRAQQIQFFNRRGAHEKTLTLSNYKKPSGGKWRPMTLDMVNHLNKRRTVLKWSGYKFGVNLQASDFDSQRLGLMSQ